MQISASKLTFLLAVVVTREPSVSHRQVPGEQTAVLNSSLRSQYQSTVTSSVSGRCTKPHAVKGITVHLVVGGQRRGQR